MSTATDQRSISAQDYLAGESDAKRRHEYVEGIIYAIVGATNPHNRIATNATGNLYSRLRGKAVKFLTRTQKFVFKIREALGFITQTYLLSASPTRKAIRFTIGLRLL